MLDLLLDLTPTALVITAIGTWMLFCCLLGVAVETIWRWYHA